MLTKIQRSLRNFNRIIDNDYQKLSDKVKILTLSHNRMSRLLKMSMRFIEHSFDINDFTFFDWIHEAEYLHRQIYGEFHDLDTYKGLERRKNG